MEKEDAPATEVVAAAVPSPPPAPSLAPVESAAPAAAQADAYHIQIGAFSRQPRAQEAAAALEQQGYAAAVLPLLKQDSTLWRVRAVGYATRQAAKEGQAALAKLGHTDAQVVEAESPPAARGDAALGTPLKGGVKKMMPPIACGLACTASQSTRGAPPPPWRRPAPPPACRRCRRTAWK